MPISFIHDEAMAVVDHYRVTRDDILLHLLPVHHATGLGMMFFPFLIGGASQEFRSTGGFDPAWTWERWKQGAPHPQKLFFSGVPTIYMRMMRYYQQSIAPRADAQDYIRGARAIRTCMCGTSALPAPIAEFWSELLAKKILLRFGMTEVGAVIKMSLDDPDVPDGSIGKVAPGCDVILSDGDEGEILAKSPGMMSKFLFDPEATAASHTPDGRYRTGDIARRDGEYYFILGRASVDIIKSGGYKISALDIEREMLGLVYISEVMVVGVPDEEYGERVAALVRIKDEREVLMSERHLLVPRLDLHRLREDLKTGLAGYKMPTVLRVITEEIPKSGTGKVEKKALGPRFFPREGYHNLPEVEVWKRRSSLSKL
jgi:malonyl-CoA/methylmalonyl-CoA synthetase